MTVRVRTKKPDGLLELLYRAIDGNSAGRATSTWSYDDDRDLFQAVSQESMANAWFHPVTTKTELVFKILPPKDRTLDALTYAYHHGQLVQLLVDDFSEWFDAITVTPYPY
jgi:hypothetical protein